MNRALTVFLISVGCAPAEAEPVIEGAVDVVVIESDYTTGLVSGWSAELEPTSSAVPSAGDAKIVATTSGYALLERGDIHAITFLDHDLNIVHQHPLPEGSNPHDVIETDTAYWISLYQAPEVVRLSKETLEEIEPIDGRAWTDADGRPEASDLHLNGDGTVYLTVQNLDFRGVEPIPPEQSQLVHLSSSGSLIAQYPIPPNPFGSAQPLGEHELLVACNADWSVQADAGLWHLAPLRDHAELWVSETELGGNILDFAVADETVVILVSRLDFTTALLRYNRLDKTLTILEGDTQSLGCIALIHDQWVVCDRTSGRPGLRFVDLTSNRLEETLTPTTLAPLQLIEAQSVP